MSTVADKVTKPEKTSSKTMDIYGLVEMPVHHLRGFMQFIAEHNLWDEVEGHLRQHECTKLMISFEPMNAVGKLLEEKKSSGKVKQYISCRVAAATGRWVRGLVRLLRRREVVAAEMAVHPMAVVAVVRMGAVVEAAIRLNDAA